MYFGAGFPSINQKHGEFAVWYLPLSCVHIVCDLVLLTVSKEYIVHKKYKF